VKAAFDAKSIPAEVEVYPAEHGWCPPDSQVFDQVQADRAWARLLATFEKGLV
jgi:carboxymethylenebutenolidase